MKILTAWAGRNPLMAAGIVLAAFLAVFATLGPERAWEAVSAVWTALRAGG